jgi:hypothetical protein
MTHILPFIVVLVAKLNFVTSWQWQNVQMHEEISSRKFSPRDGQCAFKYYNTTDRSTRIAIFGGTTINDGEDRTTHFDLWISGRSAKDRWIQVQRELDNNGKPIGLWPSARWNHRCVIIQDDFESPINLSANESILYYSSRPPPFVFLSLGGMTSPENIENNEIWSGSISMVGWPVIGHWKFLNKYSDCPRTDGTLQFTGFKNKKTNLDYCKCGRTSCYIGQICSLTRCAGRTTKTTQLTTFSPRSGHCALSLQVEGYSPAANLFQNVKVIPTDNDLSISASKNQNFENPSPLNLNDKRSTLIFVMGGLSSGFLGDVWMSNDRGISWDLRNKYAFRSRYFHGCEIF